MPRYSHLANLLSMCYDRGGRIVGIIEDHLGESAFFDFMRVIYSRYYFRIIRVADFQRELEAYTGRSWEAFFHDWLYGAGMSDWCVDDVKIEPSPRTAVRGLNRIVRHLSPDMRFPCKATILLKQKAENTEQTVLGIRLDDGDGYQIRIPILPQVPHLELDNPPATVDVLSENCVRVVVELPCQPTQIAVDPDQVLVDADPSNNCWKPLIRWRFVPLYTQLEETDLTTAYDRWNIIVGPWIYGPAYQDPWFTRSTMAGVRAGFYRTQEFSGGVYAAYRTDDRDLVAGVDGLWSHWPWHETQVGFNIERSLTSIGGEPSDRGVLFGRYVFQYSSSLYLPPMNYLEAFTAIQSNNLPEPRETIPGAVRFDQMTTVGLHYHKDYLTPYWDPAAGYRFDVTYATGIPIFGEQEAFNTVEGQLSFVKGLPDWLGWLSETRLAGRVFAAVGLPDKGEYFTLGGGGLFRGFDLKQRQGSLVWVGSLEWRVPLVRGLSWDVIDHAAGLRNVYAAAFYDVGDAYVAGHPVGDVAHAVGAGLRFDVSWFGFVERTILRVDVAKTINDSSPVQVWVGVQQPF
jgi:hypothetical protein